MSLDEAAVTLNVDVEIGTDDDPDEVRAVLDALVDGLGLDLTDIELSTPSLWACADCGTVVTTDSTLKVTDDEPEVRVYPEEEFEDIKDAFVALSEPCPSCGVNAFKEQEFGVVVDVS